MIYARLESRICADEGFRAMPYLDTVGVPTIGYGTTSILGVAVSLRHPAITDDVARQILRQDLYTACMDAQALLKRFDDLNHVRQEVLVNMAFNLGKTRLGKFTGLIKALDSLDYSDAAQHMIDSRWYRQVKTRAERLVAAMRTGSWT
jgi:lysozyme